ncbi:hypothetical protein D3C71_1191030 [compost metagenome]
MAIVRRGGDIVMARLRRHKHRLLKAWQAQGNVALAAHLSQHLIQRPCVAAFPEDADVGIAQKGVEIPLFLKRRMILAQIDTRSVAEQDFVVDKPRQKL